MTAKTKYEKELIEAIERAEIDCDYQEDGVSLYDMGIDTGYLMALKYVLKKYRECCV